MRPGRVDRPERAKRTHYDFVGPKRHQSPRALRVVRYEDPKVSTVLAKKGYDAPRSLDVSASCAQVEV